MSTPLTNYSETSTPTVDSDENTWGGINNGVHQVWDRALGGRHTVSTTGGTTVLTSEEAQNGHIQVTGTLTSDAVIQLPTGRYRLYRVRNSTEGDYVVTYTTGVVDAETVSMPPYTSMVIALNGNNVHALGPPVERGGGFRNFFRQAGKSYDGPGIFFQDLIAGFARRTSGVIGVNLLESAAGDQIRMNGANSQSAPLVGMAPSGAGPWNTGIYTFLDAGIRALGFTTNGVSRGYFKNGLVVGAPTGADKGSGTINTASGVFVNGVQSAVMVESDANEISGEQVTFSHSLGARPKFIGWKLRCSTAEHGYASGDDTLSSWQTSADANEGATVWANATTIGLSIINIDRMRVVPRAGGSNAAAITPASWRVVFLFSA